MSKISARKSLRFLEVILSRSGGVPSLGAENLMFLMMLNGRGELDTTGITQEIGM